MNGCLCTVGVPTTDQGREIDFAIVHKTRLLQPVATELFLENLPDVTGLYVGTDASGGPEGKDGRWRVVAWAVVIAQAPNGPFPVDSTLNIPDLEVVGTLKGVMQVGSSVAEGESQALCEAAEGPRASLRAVSTIKQPLPRQKMRSCS